MSVTPRTITPAAPPPRVAATGGAPPGPPPGTGFDLFLQVETQARTAPAEGREAQTETPTGPVTPQQDVAQEPAREPVVAPVAEVPADVPVTGETPAPVTEESPLPVDPALVLADQTSTTADGAPAPTAGPALEGAGTEQTGVEAPVPPGGSSPMPEAPEPVLEGAGPVAGPAVDPEAAATAAASASDPDVEPAPGHAPAQAQAPARPVAAAPAEVAETPAADDAPARPEQGRPAEQERAANAPGRGIGLALGHERGAGHTGEPRGDGQPPAPGASTASPSQPAGQVQAAAPPVPPATGAAAPQASGALTHPLSTQLHRVQALVELAVSRGAASANLELYPAELGRVSVRLRSAAGGGLTAAMTVDRPEALQALQQSADQLRKALEERGVEVVRLEIGLSPEGRGDEARTGARSDGRDASGAGARRGGTDAATDHDHDDAPSRVRPLNPGALIDVQA